MGFQLIYNGDTELKTTLLCKLLNHEPGELTVDSFEKYQVLRLP